MVETSGRGRIVNRSGLSEVFGVSLPTIDEWVRRGCPVVERGGRGRQWQFNTARVRSWREEVVREEATGVQVVPADELKRRKLEAETEMAELDLERARDLVAPIEQIERAMAKAFGEVRANMRNVLPSRLARRLVGETSETRIKAAVLEEVDLALEALADDTLINEDDLEDSVDDLEEAS